MTERYQRGGVVWPILLILGGGLLLLNNLDLVDLSLFALLFRLWPAILLAVGIDLLVPKTTRWATVLAFALVLAVFAGSYWILDQTSATSGEGVSISQPLNNVQSADIYLEPPIGRLLVSGNAGTGLLIEGTVDSIADIAPETEYSVRATRGEYHVYSTASGVSVTFPPPQTRWEVALTDDVPVSVRSDMGVGETQLDLKTIQLEGLRASFGVGRAEVSLPVSESVDIDIEGGVGEILVRVPAGASVRIIKSGGLTTMTLPAGYVRGNDGARSQGQAGASAVTLRIDLGIGIVRIVEWSP